MSFTLARAIDVAGIELPEPRVAGFRKSLGAALSAAVRAGAERLVAPRRDVPPEWFRFPLP